MLSQPKDKCFIGNPNIFLSKRVSTQHSVKVFSFFKPSNHVSLIKGTRRDISSVYLRERKFVIPAQSCKMSMSPCIPISFLEDKYYT